MMTSRQYMTKARDRYPQHLTFAGALEAVPGITPKQVKHGLGQIKHRLPKRWPSIKVYEKWLLDPRNQPLAWDSPYRPMAIFSDAIAIQPWAPADYQKPH